MASGQFDPKIMSLTLLGAEKLRMRFLIQNSSYFTKRLPREKHIFLPDTPPEKTIVCIVAAEKPTYYARVTDQKRS